MIPEFNTRGSLPPGIYETMTAEIEGGYASNGHHRQFVDRLN